MIRFFLFAVLALAVRPILATAETNMTLRTCRALRETLLEKGNTRPIFFDVTGNIVLGKIPQRFPWLVLNDGDGEVSIDISNALIPPSFRAESGDLIRLTGHVRTYENQQRIAKSYRLSQLTGRRKVDPPLVTGSQVINGAHIFKAVRIKGRILDVIDDEIDPHWSYFILNVDGCRVYAFFGKSQISPDAATRFIDATVEMTCLCDRMRKGARRLLGPYLVLFGSSDLRVLVPAPADPFDVPSLEDLRGLNASVVDGFGRRRATGTALAVAQSGSFILETDDGRIINVDACDTPPPCGAHIEVCGRVSTDIYHINLHRPCWKAAAGEPSIHEVQPMTTGDLLTDTNGNPMVKAEYHGKPIQLKGIVRCLPTEHGPDPRLYMESDGFLVPIDPGQASSPFAGIELGARIAVTGICNMETDSSARRDSIPRIVSFSTIVRNSQDVEVLVRPPWWTPRRLLYLVGALLAALVGILIWNLILNRLVERRSRELMRTRIARDEANLKTEERMRLAVELHDTIAQDMTGVAMQIDAAEMAAECDPAGLQGHLIAARQRMHSCRENLRNCLWDLRNRPFETRHLSDAIRRTVAPHQGDAQVDIRCPLACRDLSDNTIHAVLCILRELVINAVRHGRATRIAISVGRGDDGLALHVSDNGAGFDPLDHPGPAQGHFGLLGVSERVNRLGGSLKLDSACGRGTDVTISNINPES